MISGKLLTIFALIMIIHDVTSKNLMKDIDGFLVEEKRDNKEEEQRRKKEINGAIVKEVKNHEENEGRASQVCGNECKELVCENIQLLDGTTTKLCFYATVPCC